jgi:hypothetical protein
LLIAAATPSHITCHTPNAAEDEEILGDIVEDTAHHTLYPLEGIGAETSFGLPLPHPAQPLDSVNEQGPRQMSNDDATNILGKISEFSLESRASSINSLPSIRSLISACKPEHEKEVADQRMTVFAARVSVLPSKSTTSAKIAIIRCPASYGSIHGL